MGCQLSGNNVPARGHLATPALRLPIAMNCRKFKASEGARSNLDDYIFGNVTWPANVEHSRLPSIGNSTKNAVPMFRFPNRTIYATHWLARGHRWYRTSV